MHLYTITRTCVECQATHIHQSSNQPQPEDIDYVCSDCQCRNRFTLLSEAAVQDIDTEIVNRRILNGIRKYREYLSVSLRDALHLYSWRYTNLKEQQPDLFPLTDDQYWSGFYS